MVILRKPKKVLRKTKPKLKKVSRKPKVKKSILNHERLNLTLPKTLTIKQYLTRFKATHSEVDFCQVDQYAEIRLKDLLPKLLRKYQKISKHRLLYRGRLNMRSRYKKIQVHYLIYDAKVGYSVMSPIYHRNRIKNLSEWQKFFYKPVAGYRFNIKKIFVEQVLEAIANNPEFNREYYFKDVIGWAAYGLSKTRNSKKYPKRVKKIKKRQLQNAHYSRRRYGNFKR